MKPKCTGFSVNGLMGIYEKLVNFKKTHGNGKYYMVKVDIKSCFDSIQHDKLLDILKKFLTSNVYYTKKYVSVQGYGGRIRPIYRKTSSDDFMSFLDTITSINEGYNSIFVDQASFAP